jgi:CPA1 family monovalent cation:H+ antiporter
VLAASSGHLDLVLLGVLTLIGAFLLLASRTGVPYPVLMVVGGGVLGFLPGVGTAELDPNLVLLIFLPPLLYNAAFFTSLHDLRDNLRPIGLLAFGLVVATTIVVGVAAHAVVDGLSWGAAFTLGAVLGPTDPVAAGAIASRAGAPKRFVAIVEGEALLNDATGLIIYKVAVAAVATGSFSLLHAAGSFVLGAVGAVLVGVAVAALIERLRRHTGDPMTEVAVSLFTPYFAYLPAEALGLSAVLAAVAAGVWLGWRSPRLIPAEVRIHSFPVWETLEFLLNAALFVLIGLQVPAILGRISDQYGATTLAGWAAVVVVAVVATRGVWVLLASRLPRRLSVRIRERDPRPPWQHELLVAWTGMRGAVSLAAALAIPMRTDTGAPFPGRDVIVFLVYATVLVSILAQGLTLGPLMRRLRLEGDGDEHVGDEERARVRAAKAALERVDDLAEEDWAGDESADRVRGRYELRIRALSEHLDGTGDGGEHGDHRRAVKRLQREALEAERDAVVRLRDEGKIPEEALRRIERDLDLEETRTGSSGPGAPH